MAQPPHVDVSEGIYFVTARLKNPKERFSADECDIIESVILDLAGTEKTDFKISLVECDVKAGQEVIVFAFVIMPDHFHALLKPINQTISRVMQLIKGRSSGFINKGEMWQKGFFDFTVFRKKKFKEKFGMVQTRVTRQIACSAGL